MSNSIKWVLLLLPALALAAYAAKARKITLPQEDKKVTLADPKYKKPSLDELKKKLTPMQFEVTQSAATEPPFRNAFHDHHEKGIYVDIATGEPLFSSTDKFESGTGWPSFTRPIEDNRVVEHKDVTHGMMRVEVVSRSGASHLGHVFDDGPKPTGLRYCINSASLRFVPLEKMQSEGYGAYLAKVDASHVESQTVNACTTDSKGAPKGCSTTFETVVLAGGCFWGMEDLLRKIPGVVETEVGYSGGTTKNPTYDIVKKGQSGHAESVRVTFDPTKLSFETLLEKWYFKMHDPTTTNQQGNDIGTQYRSAIFYTSEEQRKTAEAVKARVEKSGSWKKPIVTQIVAAQEFTKAEDYHQDYLEKNPGGYTCHYMRQ